MWPQPILVQVLHDDREQEIRDHHIRQTHDALARGIAGSSAPTTQTPSAIGRIIRALGLPNGRIVSQPGAPGFRAISRAL